MKIIIDAMGGDFAPEAPVRGALLAREKYGTDIILTGRTADILRELEKAGCKEVPQGIEIANAEEVVEICDDPATAFKQKKDSSLTVGLNLLRDGQADGFISAGSTGALLAAATLLVGNLGAIPQTNLKRMMGYSSIAQAGFILPLFIGTVDGQLAPNAPFYLAVYLVMTFGAFFALAMIRIQRGSEEISAFRGLGKTNPRLALAVTIMFASLAGMPLTAGFFAKMISFVHVINTGLYLDWMLPVMIVCAASGFYYYFKVIRSMYWDKPAENAEPVQVPAISGVMLAAFSIFIVLGGLMPLFLNPIR